MSSKTRTKNGALKIGSVECRARDGKTFAEFNTFRLAINALIKAGVSYAHIWEVQSDRTIEPVCEYEVTA